MAEGGRVILATRIILPEDFHAFIVSGVAGLLVRVGNRVPGTLDQNWGTLHLDLDTHCTANVAHQVGDKILNFLHAEVAPTVGLNNNEAVGWDASTEGKLMAKSIVGSRGLAQLKLERVKLSSLGKLEGLKGEREVK